MRAKASPAARCALRGARNHPRFEASSVWIFRPSYHRQDCAPRQRACASAQGRKTKGAAQGFPQTTTAGRSHFASTLPPIFPQATRLREFVNGNHQLAHSVKGPTRRAGEATGRDWLSDTFAGPSPWPRIYIVPQQINVEVAIQYRVSQSLVNLGTVNRNRPMARNRNKEFWVEVMVETGDFNCLTHPT